MAEMMDKDLIEQVKKSYSDYTVVAYINTTSELKTICDICVTSSSAVTICNKIENDKIFILFLTVTQVTGFLNRFLTRHLSCYQVDVQLMQE